MNLKKILIFALIAIIILFLIFGALFIGLVKYGEKYMEKQVGDQFDCPQINKTIQYYEGITDTTKAGFITINNKEYNDWETSYYDNNFVETKTDKLTVNCVQVYGTEAKKKKWNSVAGVWKHYFCDSAEGQNIKFIEKTINIKMPAWIGFINKEGNNSIIYGKKVSIINEYDKNKNYLKTYCKRIEPQATQKNCAKTH
ncbi:hypothetical protein J4434_08125 [Candidatus Woesearchaeota archaeon]|nr:hypothetical protein [Candidatus Woesearchaeota archaeon]